MKHPFLDIIIVSYDCMPYLTSCLRSVFESLEDVTAKIFVQDNSIDGEISAIKEIFPQAILARNKNNIGFSSASNQAIKKAIPNTSCF